MKKKHLIIAATALALSLSACGSSTETSQTTAVEQSAESAEAESAAERDDLEAIGDVEVEQNLFDVVLTIPADYIGETTQEELEAEAAEGGYKVVLNDDGSATYTMTKQQHKEMMDEIRSSINQALNEMIGSEDYPNFTAIEANEDFTSFTVTTSASELGLTDGISVLGFYMYGGLYNIFNGTPVDNIHVDFVNADSGEIISSSNSSEMGE